MSSGADRIQISRPVVPELDGMIDELRDVLASGQLTNGKHVRRFEELVADYVGNDLHVVALASNTSGMVLSWQALGVEGEVILPAFTFPATAHVLRWNGLTPVLADCDPETFNLDLADVERKRTERTVGVAPVYIFGNAPDWDAFEPYLEQHGLAAVSDAAHAFGTRVGDRPAGAFGSVEVFSLAPTKVLTTGEGGLCITRDGDLAEKLRRMRNYGNPGDYDCRELGLNARMTEIHALLGVHAMPTHEGQVAHRQKLADAYRERLGQIPGISFQKIDPRVRSTFNYFALLVDPDLFGMTNATLHDRLSEVGIESKIYFHPPIHEQRLYKSLGEGRSFPNTEWLVRRILCVPLTGHVGEAELDRVVGEIKKAHETSSARKAAS